MAIAKITRRFPSKSADYTKAKKIIDTLEVGKDTTISVDDWRSFRGYLSRLKTLADKDYTTKRQDDKLYIIRIS